MSLADVKHEALSYYQTEIWTFCSFQNNLNLCLTTTWMLTNAV